MRYVSNFTPPAFRWLYQKNYGLVVWPVESFDSDQHFDKILDLGMDEDEVQSVQTGYIYDDAVGSHTYGLADALVKQWIADNPAEFNNKPKPPRADPPSDYYRPEVYSPFTSATQDEQLFDTTDYTTTQYPLGIIPRIIQVDTEDTNMGYHGGGLTGMFFPRTKNLYVATQEAYHLDLADELERQDSMAGYIGGGADVIPFRVESGGEVNLYEHMIKPRYRRYMKAIRDTVTAMWPELETQAYFGEEDYYEEESEYPSERSAKKLANPFVAGRYIYDKQDDKLYTSEGEEGHWGIAQRHNIDYTEERWEGPGSQFEFGYIHQLDNGQLACWPVTDFYREGPMSDRATDLLLGSGFTPWPRVSSASAEYICVFVYDGTDGNLYLGSEGETHYDLLYDNIAEEDYSRGFVLGWVFDDNGYKAVLDSIEYAEVVDPEYKADALEALSGHYSGIVEVPSSQLFRQKQINNVMGEDMEFEGYYSSYQPINIGDHIEARADQEDAMGLKWIYDLSSDQTYYWYFSDYDSQPWHTDAQLYLNEGQGRDPYEDNENYKKGYYKGGFEWYNTLDTEKKREVERSLNLLLPAGIDYDDDDGTVYGDEEHYGATNGQGFLEGGPDKSDLGLEATYAYNATEEQLYAVWGFDLHPYMLANRIEDEDFNWGYDDDYECGRIYRDKTGIAENGDVINYWVDHYSVEQDWGLSANTVKEADAAITAWLTAEIADYPYGFTVNDYNEFGPGGGLLQISKVTGMYNRRWILDIDGTMLVNNGEDSTHMQMYHRIHPELGDDAWGQFMKTKAGGYIYEDEPMATVEWTTRMPPESALKLIEDYLAKEAQLTLDI